MSRKKNSSIPRWKRNKLRKQKKDQRIVSEGRESLMQRVRHRSDLPTTDFIQQKPHVRKMSDVIIQYAAPLLKAARTVSEKRTAIEIAITMWNFSLMPKEEQVKMLAEFMNMKSEASNKSGLEEVEEIDLFHYMHERKKEMFPEMDRAILDFEITETSKEIHLNVVYDFPEEDSSS